MKRSLAMLAAVLGLFPSRGMTMRYKSIAMAVPTPPKGGYDHDRPPVRHAHKRRETAAHRKARRAYMYLLTENR